MTPEQVRQIARQEIGAQASRSQYNVKDIAFHTHNGIDSPLIISSTTIYTAAVTYLGTPFNNLPFPKGWGYAHGATGEYSFKHNLGSRLYTVVAFPLFSNPPGPLVTAGFVDSLEPNNFDINWFNLATGVPVDTAFMFILTFIANTSAPPVYNTKFG